MAFLFAETGMISRFLLHHVRGHYLEIPRVSVFLVLDNPPGSVGDLARRRAVWQFLRFV